MEETLRWQLHEDIIQSLFSQYGYQEIRLPIVENTELFSRSIGHDTDIVSKEMYTFTDRNEASLTLRPEGTTGCVRVGIEHGLFHNQAQRLWYAGPMFRHERPQKGRQRQFHQIGVETFGFAGPDIDIEMILICARLWQRLQINNNVRLEINTLGTMANRRDYRKKLVDYFSDNRDKLDEDSLTRLKQNPLRILDSKNPAMRELIDNAPLLTDYLDDESAEHFSTLQRGLDTASINYTINPKLVRGLDYYSRTVFEWITDLLGTQGTVCAGGRYDGLVEQHGFTTTPAIGFAIGVERLLELVDADEFSKSTAPHIYLITSGVDKNLSAMLLAEKLRDMSDGLRVQMHCGGGSLKSQFKRADKSGALMAVILGKDELANKQVTIKFLREERPQIRLEQSELPGFVEKQLNTVLIQ